MCGNIKIIFAEGSIEALIKKAQGRKICAYTYQMQIVAFLGRNYVMSSRPKGMTLFMRKVFKP